MHPSIHPSIQPSIHPPIHPPIHPLEPFYQVCGNGIVEGDEACDCGSNDTDICHRNDPCCQPGKCELIDGADCRLNHYDII